MQIYRKQPKLCFLDNNNGDQYLTTEKTNEVEICDYEYSWFGVEWWWNGGGRRVFSKI